MVLKQNCQSASRVKFHEPSPLIGERKKKLRYVKVLRGKPINDIPKPDPPKKKFYIPGSYQVKNNLAPPPNVERIHLEPRPISKYWTKKTTQECNPRGTKKTTPVSHYCPKSRAISPNKYKIKPPSPVEDISYGSSNLDKKQQKLREHCEQTCKTHTAKPSTSGALLGYDWIQSYVDDLDNGIIWKDDRFFEELKKFRDENKKDCISPNWRGYLDHGSVLPSSQESTQRINRNLTRVGVPKDFSVFIHNKTRMHHKDSLALSQNR